MDLTEKDKIDLVKQVMKLKIYEMVKSLVADDLYGLTVYQYALSMNEAIEAYKDVNRKQLELMIIDKLATTATRTLNTIKVDKYGSLELCL